MSALTGIALPREGILQEALLQGSLSSFFIGRALKSRASTTTSAETMCRKKARPRFHALYADSSCQYGEFPSRYTPTISSSGSVAARTPRTRGFSPLESLSLGTLRSGTSSSFGAQSPIVGNNLNQRPNLQRCFGWRKKDTKNVLGRAQKLVRVIQDVPDVKEEVYTALDLWCAWELQFPMLALKKGLQLLKEQRQWRRVIQVSKWMLSKGQGRTLGTYNLMIEAYNETDRIQEMEELWSRVLAENLESVPRAMFNRMMKIYEKRKLPLKVLEVFGSMDAMGIKPDEVILERVEGALTAVGAPAKAEELRRAYPLLKTEYRYVNGVKRKVRVADLRKWRRDVGAESIDHSTSIVGAEEEAQTRENDPAAAQQNEGTKSSREGTNVNEDGRNVGIGESDGEGIWWVGESESEEEDWLDEGPAERARQHWSEITEVGEQVARMKGEVDRELTGDTRREDSQRFRRSRTSIRTGS